MEQGSYPPISPVLAAMAAMDHAVTAHKLVVQRLSSVMLEAERRDELLRRIDPEDTNLIEEAARAFAVAVGLVQSLSDREERARAEMQRAQNVLALARRSASHARVETLQVELEIDAASIWDLVGRFEAELRGRLELHGKIAEELEFFSNAAGESARPSTPWTPVLGASGEELWTGIARGAAELAHRLAAPPPAAHPALTAPDPLDKALRHAVPSPPSAPPRLAANAAAPTASPAPAGPPRVEPAEESARQRLARVLREEQSNRR